MNGTFPAAPEALEPAVDLFGALVLAPCLEEDRPPAPPLAVSRVSFFGPLTGLTTGPVPPPADRL